MLARPTPRPRRRCAWNRRRRGERERGGTSRLSPSPRFCTPAIVLHPFSSFVSSEIADIFLLLPPTCTILAHPLQNNSLSSIQFRFCQSPTIRGRLEAAARSRRDHSSLQTTNPTEGGDSWSGKAGQRETGKRHLRCRRLNRSAHGVARGRSLFESQMKNLTIVAKTKFMRGLFNRPISARFGVLSYRYLIFYPMLRLFSNANFLLSYAVCIYDETILD